MFLSAIFQISAAILLVRIIGFLGHHTKRMGYTNFSNLEESGALGYNLAFRILAPGVYTVFIAIILYLVDANILVNNIWFIAIWYTILNLIVSILFGRFALINKLQYILTHVLAIFVAYCFYVLSLSKGTFFILPDSDNFRTELWVILILFFYAVLVNYEPNQAKYVQKKEKYIQSRYKFFCNKYQKIIEADPFKVDLLQKLFFAIMILEDLNRNVLTRFIERALFPFGLVRTTGIMQVSSTQNLTDNKSVALAKRRIQQIYTDNENKFENNYDLIKHIAEKYNPSGEYIQGIIEVFRELFGWELLCSSRSDKREHAPESIFPEMKDIEEYKDILVFFEEIAELVKEKVKDEKLKLNKDSKKAGS